MLLLEQTLTSSALSADFYHCKCPATETKIEEHVYSRCKSDNTFFIRKERKNSRLFRGYFIGLTNKCVIQNNATDAFLFFYKWRAERKY